MRDPAGPRDRKWTCGRMASERPALRAHLAAALTWLPRDAGAEPANIATHSTSSYYFYRGHGTLAGAKGSHELRASAATRWEDMPKRGRAQTTESYDLPFCKSGGRVGVKLEGVGVGGARPRAPRDFAAPTSSPSLRPHCAEGPRALAWAPRSGAATASERNLESILQVNKTKLFNNDDRCSKL